MKPADGDDSTRMIVGLGNPGPRYANTPHNAGFLVVHELAARADCRWRNQSRLSARTASFSQAGRRALLVEPQTFMNESGVAVASAAAYWKIPPERILVVLDDADLDMGRVRLRDAGGSGGHRGLASVIQRLGSQAFPRLRVGIGRGDREANLVDHVLAPLSATEDAWMKRIVALAADAAMFFLSKGTDSAMNQFNGVIVSQENHHDNMEKIR